MADKMSVEQAFLAIESALLDLPLAETKEAEEALATLRAELDGLRRENEVVEFCASGGRSPNTLAALRVLFDAMEADNKGAALAAMGGEGEVVCAVCEEVVEKIEDGYVPRGHGVYSKPFTTPPAKVPEELTQAERRALEGQMSNAEYEAGDVEDACPNIYKDEDAYWAWNTYHGLRKLLAAAPAPKEGV